MISSIRLDGSTAAMAIHGATDTEVFRAYVAEVLCPTLRPGDMVIMDNLIAHKSEPTLELIAAAGAEVLLLPPYSPDLNPIEKMWRETLGAAQGCYETAPLALRKASLAVLLFLRTGIIGSSLEKRGRGKEAIE